MNRKKLKTAFTIEEVSDIAGVNSFALRNWEDRYSLFTPDRDANGRRIFSELDTLRAVVAAELTKRHHKISKVAAELQECTDPYLVLTKNVEGESFLELRKDALQGLLRYDVEAFQQCFMHLLGNYDVEFLADHFFYPIYRELEDLKTAGQISAFQFQFCQKQLGARIFRLTGSFKANRPRDGVGRVLITGFPENEFEDSLLILYLVLERYGWQVIYGGPRTNMTDLQEALKSTGSDLSILVGNNLKISDYERHESALRTMPVPIIIGGRLALNLLAAGKNSTDRLEFTSLRPGPFARLLQYKLESNLNLL